jgi:16S rRNA (cytidine1402-2'-O)-methyltransferase
MNNREAKLVLVPTPIGNLGDISKRAIENLTNCDVVYCEDTRVTGKLLSALSIKKPLLRMDENSISEHVQKIINDCKERKLVCFCSDAGMPGISDPGSRIVEACRNEGVAIEVLPGANACLTALVASGFNTEHFYFEGFLPKKKTQKQNRLSYLLNMGSPFVVYESPKRMSDTLECVSALAPKRRVCVTKELTKLYEEVRVGTSLEVFKDLEDLLLKGEFVIVVDAPSAEELSDDESVTLTKAKNFAKKQAERGIAQSEIRSDLQEFFNVSKNEAYEISLNL